MGSLFEDDPEKVTAAEYALLPALAEWKESGCNALADKNDIASITKRINGGYNGFSDRKDWFAKVYPLVSNGVAWTDAEPDQDIKDVQESLNALGYGLTVDGRKGPATEGTIRDFQAKNGLKVDGIAGALTRAKMQGAIDGLKANADPATEPLPEGGALKSGAVQGGLATAATAAGGAMIVAKEVKTTVDDAREANDGTVIGFIFFGVFLVGGLLILWNRYRQAGKLPAWLGG